MADTDADAKGPAAQFTLSAGGRDYLFAVESSADADAWVGAISDVLKNHGRNAPRGASSTAEVEVSAAVVEVSDVRVKGVAPTAEAVRLTPSQVEVVGVATPEVA